MTSYLHIYVRTTESISIQSCLWILPNADAKAMFVSILVSHAYRVRSRLLVLDCLTASRRTSGTQTGPSATPGRALSPLGSLVSSPAAKLPQHLFGFVLYQTASLHGSRMRYNNPHFHIRVIRHTCNRLCSSSDSQMTMALSDITVQVYTLQIYA